MKSISHINTLRLIGAIIVVLALVAVALQGNRTSSVEVGFTELSPKGIAGGRIVPASCNGGPNAPNYGQGCTSAANSCGQTNSGTYDTCGNCGASTPANPANYGNACTSSANACGQTNSGTITCAGTCSASAPSNSSCPTPTITADPPTVFTGDQTTITWACPAPNTSASGSNFSTGGSASNSTNVTVNATTVYTVVCDQTTTQNNVTVTAISPSVSLVASPSRVHSGNTSTLSWYATGVTSCTLTGPSTTDGPVTASGGAIASQGSPRTKTTAPITGQSTYRLSCQTDAGPVSTSVTVNLVPVEIEI